MPMTSPMQHHPSIECRHLSLSYQQKIILQDISFRAESGKITVLLGKNGSGKTSLLRCLSGIQKISGGEIFFSGVSTQTMSQMQKARQIAIMPQTLPQIPITVAELIAMGRTPHLNFGGRLSARDRQIANHAVQRSGIQEHVHDLVSTLSGGERQLAFFAMTLAREANRILLDEPTASLDAEYRWKVYEIMRKLRDGGYTVLATLHHLEEAVAIADHILVLDRGKLVFDGSATEFIDSSIPETIFKLIPIPAKLPDGTKITTFRFQCSE